MKRLLCAALISLLVSCANQAQTGARVTPDQFESGMKAKGVQLLDVRNAQEFKAYSLEGALQADWNDPAQFRDRTGYLDKNKPVYVYCMSGSRSSAAANYLRETGFAKVVELNGGLLSWKRAGKAVLTAEKKQETSFESYQQMIGSGDLVLVDYGAEWCPPCKKMEPVLQSWIKEKKGAVRLVKIDGGTDTQLMKINLVEAMPTFIVYKNGKETARKQGVLTKEELELLISR
jgi:rhodanese-related sulfurtransferase